MQRQEVVSELARGAAKSNSTSRTNKIAKTHCVSILATVITSILASNIAYAASNSNETVENKGFVHVNASGSSDDSAKNFGNFTAAAGATGANAITVGVSANTGSDNSIAIGTESKVKKWSKNSLALGYKASVGNVGPTTHVDSNNAIAIGSEAEAIRDSAIAIGDKASAANYNAISIGKKIQNGSIGATAIGGGAEIGGYSDNSVAIGTGATVGVKYSEDKTTKTSNLHHERAIAIGYNAKALGQQGISIGTGSNVEAVNGLALGQDAKSKNAGDIAIGYNSESSAANTVSDIQIGEQSLTLKDTVKQSKNNGTVSFGKDKIKRQIQNVAAGSISETSTDAINGAQLYNVIKATNEIANTEYKFLVNGNGKTMGNKSNSATNNTSNTLNFAAGEGLDVAYENDSITYKLKDELKQSIENAAKKTYVDNSVNSVRTATDEIAKTEYKFKVNGKDAKTMTNNGHSTTNNTNNSLNFKAGEGLNVAYENDAITYKLKDELKQSIENAAKKTDVDTAVNSVRDELKQSIANAPNKSYVDNSVNSVRRELQQTDKKLRGGIAGAVAMANIPTANRAGGTMVGVGVGNFKGRSAVAVGINRASDTNRTHFKMSGSATTSGDYAVGAGMGYQW